MKEQDKKKKRKKENHKDLAMSDCLLEERKIEDKEGKRYIYIYIEREIPKTQASKKSVCGEIEREGDRNN